MVFQPGMNTPSSFEDGGTTNNMNKTKVVKLEVTFSQANPGSGIAYENDEDDDSSFIQNIELCHLANWTVQKCTAVLGNDPTSIGAEKLSTNNGSNDKTDCKLWLVLSLTHFVIFTIALWMGSQNCSIEVAVLERTLPLSKKARLAPATSLVRIQDPLPSYSEEWQPVPLEYAKTFYADTMKQSHPFLRALHHQGFVRVSDFENAHIVYSHHNNPDWATQLYEWQRFNYIPDQEHWKNSYKFHYHYKQWEQQTGIKPASVYIPETYLLTHFDKANAKMPGSKDFDGNAFSGGPSKYDYNTHLVKQDITDFQRKLRLDNPNTRIESKNSDAKQQERLLPETFWLVKTDDRSADHQFFAQVSDHNLLKDLMNDMMKDLLDQGLADLQSDSSNGGDGMATGMPQGNAIGSIPGTSRHMSRSFLQKYICDRLVIDATNSFTIRVYWAVVSLEPLIVMYHDGYITGRRMETSTFSWNRTHIKTGRKWDTRPSFFQMSFSEFEKSLDRSISQSFPAGSPTQHVRSQMKEALADMIQVFQTKSFKLPDGVYLTAENAYSLFCADFILDESLDVWLVSTPKGVCNLDEDHYFRIDLHASMFQGMISMLEEVWEKQENEEMVLPLKRQGNWEIVYGDGLRFQYNGYDPVNRTLPKENDFCLGLQ
ncbi:tubulin-tyrosine ligase family protein [Nitzschia inconspicua]|nr:tubulin-tyrosine ligase family protein [Nitzschia inconspicua]